MWSAVLPNRKLRLAVKVVAAALLFVALFTLTGTEVEFVYTGF